MQVFEPVIEMINRGDRQGAIDWYVNIAGKPEAEAKEVITRILEEIKQRGRSRHSIRTKQSDLQPWL